MDAVKEIVVTESFMSLDQYTRGCQNKESYETCTSRYFHETILTKCGCLPWKLGSDKVLNFCTHIYILKIALL